MTVAELIEKLKHADPDLLVCTEDGETGEQPDISVYELTRHVDRTHPEWPYVGHHNTLEPQERVIVITHWGKDEDSSREL